MVTNDVYHKVQFWLLVIISLTFFYLAPPSWHYAPDSGIYIGTAKNLLESGTYWFNGYPNLLYYPGFSSLLTIPLSLFGLDFVALHLFCIGLVVAALWLSRIYFGQEGYGLAGLAVPLLLACNSIVHQQLATILSDSSLLVCIVGALLFWRAFERNESKYALYGCLLLCALAPLVRFEGLFLPGAFGLAFIITKLSRNGQILPVLVKASALSLLTLSPFLLWTWRNYVMYSPDTFNMANDFFFGLKGLALYAPGHFEVDWIDAPWKYGAYNTLYNLKDLLRSFVGDIANRLPLEVDVLLVLLPLTAGLLPWFRAANHMERVLALSLAGFFFWRTMHARNLYVVDRYWLSLLPFVAIIGSLGLRKIHKSIETGPLRHLYLAIVLVVAVIISSNGLHLTLSKASDENREYDRQANIILQEISRFVQSNSSEDTTVAVTDWGILPLFIHRKSYQLLNDKDHLLSLKRILKYKTKLLVILDGSAASAPYAREMVNAFPDAFTLMKDFEPSGGAGPKGSVYRINLRWIQENIGH